MANRVVLTATFARQVPPPSKRAVTYWDEKLPGFGLRVTQSGHKAFVVRYQVDGPERQSTIGPFPLLSVAAARERAQRIRAAAREGRDLIAERNAKRAAVPKPTVSRLKAEYLSGYVAHRRTAAGETNEIRYWRYIEESLGAGTPIDEITPERIRHVHIALTRKGATNANRIIVSLSTAFNLAKRLGWIEKNPCEGFKRNKEHARQRFLNKEETDRVVATLDSWADPTLASALLVLLSTGARLGELTKARWVEFDLQTGDWNKPASQTKSARPHTIPLNPTALRSLLALRAFSAQDGRVLPGSEKTWISRLEKGWRKVRVAAGVPDVRLHDLRHSFASFLANAGVSLPMIGALLGHSTPSTTHRYAHLANSSLRLASEAASKALSPRAITCKLLEEGSSGQE